MTLPAYTGILTPAHRQLITAIGEQGRATVLSVAPVDRAAAGGAVRHLYDAHKLPRPGLTVWMDSPLGCIYAAGVVGQFREQLRWQLLNQLRQQLIAQMGGGLWAKFAGQIREQLGDRLGDRLRDPLRDQLEDELSGQLEGQLCGQLWDQLRGQIRGQLHGQLWDQLQGQLWDQFWDQFGGQLRIQRGGQFSDQGREEEGQGWDEHLHSVFPWNDAYALAFYECALPIAGAGGPLSRGPEQRCR